MSDIKLTIASNVHQLVNISTSFYIDLIIFYVHDSIYILKCRYLHKCQISCCSLCRWFSMIFAPISSTTDIDYLSVFTDFIPLVPIETFIESQDTMAQCDFCNMYQLGFLSYVCLYIWQVLFKLQKDINVLSK